MDLKKHTRREFIRLTGITAAGVAIAACAPDAPDEPTVVDPVVDDPIVEEPEVEEPVDEPVDEPVVEEPVEVPSIYNEAPMLAERVAAGELPPVDERLPEEPRVCEVYERIGDYGGTLTVGDLTMNLSGGDVHMVMDRPNWLRISKDATYAVPHILRDWEVSDDFTEVTCYMRSGMKWSDGHPLTTADVEYFCEDVLGNTEITPVPHMAFRWGGELMQLTIIDDYTFKLSFAAPHPSWELVNMAHLYGFWGNTTWVPSHYLKQFHIKYNDNANDLAQEEGFDFWYQLHGRENNRGQSIDRPKLEAFIPVRDTPSMSFLERNPYYHAVDPEGNQLPYVDRVNMDRAADLSVYDAKVVGGSYDFAAFQARVVYYATYAEGAEQSDARMLLWPSGKSSECMYNVNMNYEDDEWREVFSDDRFRKALSLAINRKEINDVIYFGNATENQLTATPTSRHYRPELALAFTEYDPEQANSLLDEMGLEWNATRTHRLWPDSGRPMIISWDFVETETPKGPITELVEEYWKAIGIEIRWQSITRTLLTQRVVANEEPMSLWHSGDTMDTLFLSRPFPFAPHDGDESTWGVLWGRWYNTRGEMGEEPPQVIKDLFDCLDEYMITYSEEPARKVLESQAEHIWTIGTVGMAPHPLFVRNNLKNITETGGFWTWDTLWTYPEFPEQWFMEA